MTSATAALRRVSIETLSARTELLLVVRVVVMIVVLVWLYLASHLTGFGGGTVSQRNLLPFQMLIADRPPGEQRIFRELQEGLLEAERIRSTTAWPPVHQLAADGIPPFAADPTQPSKLTWELIQRGSIVNYLGIPETGDGPGWLLLVQEPVAGAPPDQTFEDEEHHRLANGTMLRVSTWVHADGRKIGRRLVPMPQIEGWTQLYAVGPSVPSAK
jgi:hypothetical protein